MKKNILIIILTVIAIFTVLYAFIKADEAEKARMEAYVAQQEAEALRDQAVILLKAAKESTAAVLEQQKRAEEALQDCLNK